MQYYSAKKANSALIPLPTDLKDQVTALSDAFTCQSGPSEPSTAARWVLCHATTATDSSPTGKDQISALISSRTHWPSLKDADARVPWPRHPQPKLNTQRAAATAETIWSLLSCVEELLKSGTPSLSLLSSALDPRMPCYIPYDR